LEREVLSFSVQMDAGGVVIEIICKEGIKKIGSKMVRKKRNQWMIILRNMCQSRRYHGN
jgi:hypothetical protein